MIPSVPQTAYQRAVECFGKDGVTVAPEGFYLRGIKKPFTAIQLLQHCEHLPKKAAQRPERVEQVAPLLQWGPDVSSKAVFDSRARRLSSIMAHGTVWTSPEIAERMFDDRPADEALEATMRLMKAMERRGWAYRVEKGDRKTPNKWALTMAGRDLNGGGR